MAVAADHMRRIQNNACRRVMVAAAQSGDFRTRGVDRLLRGVLHNAESFRHTGRNNGTTDDRTVGVPALNPIVINDAGVGRIDIAHPYDRTAWAWL